MNPTPPVPPKTPSPQEQTARQPARSQQPSQALVAWLAATLAVEGWSSEAIAGLELRALQTEASFRQFYRATGPTASVVLMDSPPDKERNDEFVSIAGALAANDILVPRVLAHDEPAGWLVLSDLGQTHFIDRYQEGDHPRCLQHALVTLERIAPVRHPAIEPYTPARLSDELDIFTDWLVTAACGLALPSRLFEPARERLLANAADQADVCVHRDFHCKNLLVANANPNNPENEHSDQQEQTGVLDFQDALIGPKGYDLASLLHDCYWRFDDRTIDSVIDQVVGVTRKNVDLLAVQRQLKAIGIFARLAQRDGKTSHLRHIGPVLESLIGLCQRYPELHELGDWLASALRGPALKWVAAQGKRDGQR